MRLKRVSSIRKVFISFFISFTLSVGPRNWLQLLTCLRPSLLPGGPPPVPLLPSPLSRLQVLTALGCYQHQESGLFT